MAKSLTQHRCISCGYIQTKWFGKCPSCNEWNTAHEELISQKTTSNKVKRSGIVSSNKPVKLNTVVVNKESRVLTGVSEFDRVMGGGIVRDSVIIIASLPGMGKSTLLGYISNVLASKDEIVLYASGEESQTQIKRRMDRICEKISDNLWVVAETCVEKIEEYIKEINPSIIICDSLQTMYLESIPNSRAGSPTQINEVAYKLIEIAKNPENPKVVICISQVTKDETLRGELTVEHAVDGVYYLEGDRTGQLRKLYATKARFADTSECGMFIMTENGLIPLDNPSEHFTTQRDEPVAGCALTVTKEGSRNFVAEIESLVSKSYFGFPSRKGVGVRKELVDIIIEILEQRAGLNFYDKNVTVMTTGGLRLTETAVNLSVAMSIASSYYNTALPEKIAFIGELGLTGEIKTVPGIEPRIKELARMGFDSVYIPKGNLKKELTGIKIIEVSTIREIISKMFDSKVKKLEKRVKEKTDVANN